jgi:MFS family permease
MGPSSDTFATTLVYKLADISTPEHLRQNPTDKKVYAISFFSHYRKFGSIGWAFFAPIGGLLINQFDFGLNFIIAGIGFIMLTVFGIFTIKTDAFFTQKPQIQNTSIDKKTMKKQNGVIYSVSDLLKNKTYFVFLLAGFFYTVASTMTYQTQGVFYGLFAPSNYFAIAMTYSVAAFIEWPVMSIIAKSVKKSSWENIIVLSYTFTAIRFLLSPLLIILGANIWWAYVFQISTGIIFGMRWPATTLGIHSVLRDDQKTLGQSFFGSASLVASLTGSIIGAAISFIIKDNLENSFIMLYWVAAVLSAISAVWFYKKSRDNKTN